VSKGNKLAGRRKKIRKKTRLKGIMQAQMEENHFLANWEERRGRRKKGGPPSPKRKGEVDFTVKKEVPVLGKPDCQKGKRGGKGRKRERERKRKENDRYPCGATRCSKEGGGGKSTRAESHAE